MNPRLQRVQQLLRRAGLMELVERFRYGVSVLQTRRDNAAFRREDPAALCSRPSISPSTPTPPRRGGTTRRAAKRRPLPRGDDLAPPGPGCSPEAAPWGCGPGRVIRHLPALLGPSVLVWGSDFNPETVERRRRSLAGVSALPDSPHPPLPFEAGTFDGVYSISVFTHLSVRSSDEWIAELTLVARPAGTLIFSTNGPSRLPSLLPEERRAFEAEGLVVRGRVREGTNMFGAFHHPRYVRERLLRGLDAVEHAPGGFPHVDQDLWVARKPQ